MENKIIHIKSITEGHRMRGLPAPHHPLISIVDCGELHSPEKMTVVIDFYVISLKRNCNNLAYGQQRYDFDEGVMGFMGPNQVLSSRGPGGFSPTGWMLFIHPDFLWNTPLAKKIKEYEFFYYAVNEALFLSEKEEALMNDIIRNIQQEYNSNTDKFSEDVIIAQLELLLTYSQRFYERQFRTRKKTNAKILDQFEEVLTAYFNSGMLLNNGLPTVQYLAEKVNISPKYLSSLLKVLTGQTAQQHIHEKLIEKAKEKLSTTELTVSQIAYELGFEHSQSFNKLFKSKTKLSPLEFRQSFN